ncbi:tryptophan dimethylallyltransferase family protein, partial [Streptomyces sp. NPDC056049]|uniref:tryptophan dimethylallyltransferase family protein n=1 Tax=Streptomyces sp. NPDC056049 TaxID=3345693 RepID=UPI0035DB74F8
MTSLPLDISQDPEPGTLGAFTRAQLVRLCDVVGLSPADTETYADTLVEALGPSAQRSLALPPPTRTFLSDDHTPVEYSLSFSPGRAPALRVLIEPGCGAENRAENGRIGLEVVRAMARRWDFSTERLDEIEDLFFPAQPKGPLALWIALELVPGGVPKVKVYLNPAASGKKRSAKTLRKALRRLGHREAYAALPSADGHPFLALDLGRWETPRLKVYTRHLDLSAAEAGHLSRTGSGPGPAEIQEFFRTAAATDGLHRRPGLSCHSFTEAETGRPSGFTLHIPVRDYARDDGEVLDRAVDVLRSHGMDPGALVRSLPALTPRRPEDGVGLIAYLALVHQQGHPPRVTAYLSSEAYAVRPPAKLRRRAAAGV